MQTVTAQSPYLSFTKSSTVIAHMRKIKEAFDPNGIMNPYKVFPTKEQEQHGEIVRKRAQAGC